MENTVLKRHIKRHTREKAVACNICGKMINNKGLENHIKIHTGDKSHVCPQCAKTFIESGNLVRHMRVHTGERPYLCNYCGKTFKQMLGLRRHHKKTHSGSSLTFPCDGCEQSFTVTSDLRAHKRAHHEKNSFPCDQSDKEFAGALKLREHKANHSTKRKVSFLSCDHCERLFWSLDDLEMHRRCHVSVITLRPK